MSEDFFLTYLLPVIFLLIGLGLLAGAGYHWTRTRAFLAKARNAFGEVIALKKIPPQQPGSEAYGVRLDILTFCGQAADIQVLQ